MESSATEAARKKANALLAERAAIVKVGVDECLKCTVEVPSEICRFCDQPAIMRNRGHCAACASFWIPALNRPGSLLLGPEFMHSSVVPYNKVTCDCGLELCKKIGYCQRGRFTLPVDDKKRQAWFDMAGMKVDAYDQTNSLNDKKKKNYLAYWHFPPDRRKYDAERQTWSLIDAEESHKPNPTKSYDFLVPSYPLGEFIVDVRAARRSSQRSQSGRERRSLDASSPPAISAGSADLQRAVQQSARADAAEEDAAALRRRERELLEAAGSQSMVEVVDALKGLLDMTGEGTISAAVESLKRGRDEAAAAAAAAGPPLPKPGLQALRYANCTDADVDVLTYHGDREAFDAFLDMINVKKDDNDRGECTRLRRFQQTKSDERKCKKRKRKEGAGRKRTMEWKDEYLLWSCYVHCGCTTKLTARLFKVHPSTVSDIVRTWTVYLDQAFALLMPNPTKPELLRTYPRHTIRMLGHARVAKNLDATDKQCETPRFADSQSALYSKYHSQTGAKTLAGCTPVGTVPHPWVTEAYPSAISDEKQVEMTRILDNLRPYDAVNVDRGFCIENLAIKKKVIVIRPQKKMRNQAQFSVADANMQHKVGTTRIVIEQKNSHAKRRCGYLQRVTPALQFDMVGAIMRIAFCMANFNAPVTPGVHSGSTGNRACCAGVLWLGHDEPETVNALWEPELWCSRSQLDLHRRLSRVLTGRGFNAALVSELVLLETSLEKSASNREAAARTQWVNWKERNSDWEGNQGKHADLRSLALRTLDACDAARKSAGRLGVY